MQKQILQVRALDTQATFKKENGYWNGTMPVLITYTDGTSVFHDVVSYGDKTKMKCAVWLMKNALRLQRVTTLEIYDQVA